MKRTPLHTLVPGAVKRLGEATFAVMNAWRLAPSRAEVLYVETALLSEYLGKPLNDEQAKDWIRQNLLLTLDESEGIPGSPPIKVFVDRQADPLNISLVGNSGSGRAVYAGDCFNVKGIGKTVLATSSDPLRSNGVLDLVGSLWEMICSNVTRTNLETGAAPTVAVIDLKKSITVPWYPDPIPSGMIVRFDRAGELDRPSHLFFCGKPVPEARLLRIADRFGAQDAEKFIERILHGGWSAGNISVDGGLIDYDSVFAIRGRAPQWSFRPNWLSNFFGREELGQKELLKALAGHELNIDRVSVASLHDRFDNTRRKQLERRFLDLAGFPSSLKDSLLTRFSKEIADLAERFSTLAGKMFPNFQATAAWASENAALSVYDVSRFFRLYPLARSRGMPDEKRAMALLKNPLGLMKSTRETQEGGMPEHIAAQLLAEFGVTSDEQLAQLDEKALAFIHAYDGFLEAAGVFNTPEDLAAFAARAYVINEERTYMNSRPGHDVLIGLLQHYRAGKIGAGHFFELLKLIIIACDRRLHPDLTGRYQADMRLFLNGCTSHLILTTGLYQHRLSLFPPENLPEPLRVPVFGNWALVIGDREHPCSVERDTDRVHILGPTFPLIDLPTSSPNLEFRRNGEPVLLSPIVRLDRPSSTP